MNGIQTLTLEQIRTGRKKVDIFIIEIGMGLNTKNNRIKLLIINFLPSISIGP